MAKAKLSVEAKTFIVQSLACFDSPSTVAAAVKKELGLDVSRQLVEIDTGFAAYSREGYHIAGGDDRRRGRHGRG